MVLLVARDINKKECLINASKSSFSSWFPLSLGCEGSQSDDTGNGRESLHLKPGCRDEGRWTSIQLHSLLSGLAGNFHYSTHKTTNDNRRSIPIRAPTPSKFYSPRKGCPTVSCWDFICLRSFPQAFPQPDGIWSHCHGSFADVQVVKRGESK